MSKYLIIISIIIPLALIAKPNQLNKTQLQKLYKQANQYFYQANQINTTKPNQAKELYNKSLLIFEQIIQEGNIHNGKLYYNIANIHYQLGNIGQAILNYKRAKQYIPNDPNLKQNLAFVRSQCQDKFTTNSQTKLLKTLLFWHYDLSPKIKTTSFFTLFILFWILLYIRLILKNKNPPLGLIITNAIFTIALFSSLAIENYQQKNYPKGVITAKTAIPRKGDALTYEKSFKQPLHQGTEFTLCEDRGKWIQIKLPDQRKCWLQKNKIEML